MTELPPGYPVLAEADVVLRDGSVCRLRPIKPSDADAIRRFHAGQSDESIYLRFFAPMPRLSDRDVERFTHVDHHDRVAFVLTVGGFSVAGAQTLAITSVTANSGDPHPVGTPITWTVPSAPMTPAESAAATPPS